MKRFNINGQSVLLFEDQLWIPVEAELTIHGTEKSTKTKKHRASFTTLEEIEAAEEISEIEESSKRARIEPEEMEKIKSAINNGTSAVVIAREFKVSVPYVYIIKSKMKKDGELKI